MPGVFVMIGDAQTGADANDLKFLKDRSLSPLLVEGKTLRRGVVARFSNGKFPGDKLLHDDADVAIAIDGVVLNFSDLKSEYGRVGAAETVKAMYQRLGDTFFRAFSGEFAGVVYDKVRERWLVFTNHTGSKPVYYYADSRIFLCASQLEVVTRTLNALGVRYSLDQFGAYCLLTYAFMLEDYTLMSEIKRLRPGHYLIVEDGKVLVRSYATLIGGEEVSAPKEEIIEHLDFLFRQAVAKEYRKDAANGYDHLISLSGGLDSRMSLWVAKEMGFHPFVAMTFSENDYLDEVIAKQIAADLHAEFIFYSLNGGRYLISRFQEAVRANGGLVLFSGSAHLLAALGRIDKQRYGLLHMGLLGGPAMGSYLKSATESKPQPWHGAYSTHLLSRIEDKVLDILDGYETDEMFQLYNRGFNAILNGSWTSSHFMEATAPFLDRDFLSYAVRIPRRMRYKSGLYREWILRKYPDAGGYVWEKTKTTLRAPSWWRKRAKHVGRVRILLRRDWQAMSMNPWYHWYKRNPQLKGWTDAYWQNNSHLLDGYPELKRDSAELFQHSGGAFKGPLLARIQVMTLLEAIRLHWQRGAETLVENVRCDEGGVAVGN